MQGTVERYPSRPYPNGSIAGEDGCNYGFHLNDRMAGQNYFAPGALVSFTPDGNAARQVSLVSPTHRQQNSRHENHRRENRPNPSPNSSPGTTSKQPKTPPYDFVPVDAGKAVSDTPVFHDGMNADQAELISGELRCSLTALTPLLVAHDQYEAKKVASLQYEVPGNNKVTLPAAWGVNLPVAEDKHILEPLMLDGHVLIPGSSLNGMLRHSLGALLNAPMERVAERSYSYRPNLGHGKQLESRAAVVVSSPNASGQGLEVNLLNLGYRPKSLNEAINNRPNAKSGHEIHRYYGGLDGRGILAKLAKKRPTHHWVSVDTSRFDAAHPGVLISDASVQQYWRTLEHLSDTEAGHISSRHPKVKKVDHKQLKQAFKALKSQSLQPGNLIYVEWASNTEKVTSIAHNFHYRWRYTDTVRNRWSGMANEETRSILSPLECEAPAGNPDDKHVPPEKLSGARLFFGYVSSDKKDSGTKGIGTGDFTRLAGRISCNIAVEQTNDPTDVNRFVDNGKAVPLKTLGLPRPSAVENYLQQPDPVSKLQVTYGDLPGEAGGELRGRKFYRHQPDAAGNADCYIDRNGIESNKAALARFVLKPKAEFKFTLRFRYLRPWELGALMLALEPWRIHDLENLPANVNDLKNKAAKEKTDNSNNPLFAHKLGHGRPLGLGSVFLNVNEMHLWDNKEPGIEGGSLSSSRLRNGEKVCVAAEQQVKECIAALGENEQFEKLDEKVWRKWLEVHRYRDQPRCDYSRGNDGKIFTWHTNRRRDHAKARRTRG